MNLNKLKSLTFLVLAILFAQISAEAQTKGYTADIPFDFSIGKKTFDAGEYRIYLNNSIDSATVMRVRGKKGLGSLSTVVMKNGDASGNGKTLLVFNRYGDHYAMKQLLSPAFGFSAPKPKGSVKVWLEGKSKPKPDTVSILLKR